MISNDRHNMTRTNFTTGLTGLDEQCNRTITQTTTSRERIKSHRFALLKAPAPLACGSVSVHMAHWKSHTNQPSKARFAKESNFATLKTVRI